MKHTRFIKVINPTFVSTCVLFSALALQPVIADVFDELDAETSDYGSSAEFESDAISSDYSMEAMEADTSESDGCAHLVDEFERWKCEEEAEFQGWKEEYFAELEAYKNRVLDVWDEAEITDKTNWVEYSDDLKTKKLSITRTTKYASALPILIPLQLKQRSKSTSKILFRQRLTKRVKKTQS